VDVLLALACTVLRILWIVLIMPSHWRSQGPLFVLSRYNPPPKWWIWGPVLWHANIRVGGWLATWFSLIGPLLLVEFAAPTEVRDSFVFGAVLSIWVAGGFLQHCLSSCSIDPEFSSPSRFGMNLDC
jgi:hypothetical protein